MSDNHAELIKQFSDVTGVDEHRATFFLESAAWELDLALYSFFENDGPGDSNPPPNRGPTAPVESANKSDSDPELLDDNDVPIPASRMYKKEKTKKKPTSRFATLQSLNQSSSSDEEEGEAFYAGGSERSGQQILGPPGKNKNNIVADMFRSVREQGAVLMNAEGDEAGGSASFSGTGYRLGATPDDTTTISSRRGDKNKKPEPEQVVVLRLWQNGFSLDGGDLRPYTDPANAEFLDHVRRGEIPPEIRRGPEMYLTMEDKRHEEFTKVTVAAKPFQGKGQMLGSPAPTTVGSTIPQVTGTTDQEANQRTAQGSLQLNESEPVCNIQIRLADGSRIVGRFNATHTVANVREYITAAVPSYQLATFTLQTTFPNRELTDASQTVMDAGIWNSLVVLRMK